MPVIYTIIPDQKVACIRAWGKVTVDDIMIQGERMFAEGEWRNGFSILCDYREITELNVTSEEVKRLVGQDKKNERLFDKSKCAVVATKDFIFGLSRMWEILSEDTSLTKMVFKDIADAIRWLGLDLDVSDWMEKPP